MKNIKLIRAAREEAQKIVAADPTLSKYPTLAARATSAGVDLHGE